MIRETIIRRLIFPVIVRIPLKKLFNAFAISIKLTCNKRKPIIYQINNNTISSKCLRKSYINDLGKWVKSMYRYNIEKIRKHLWAVLINCTLSGIILATFFYIFMFKKKEKEGNEINITEKSLIEDPEIIRINDLKIEEFVNKLRNK